MKGQEPLTTIAESIQHKPPVNYAGLLLQASKLGRESGVIAARIGNTHASSGLPVPNLLTYICDTLGASKRASKHLRSVGSSGVSNVCMITTIDPILIGKVNVSYQHRGSGGRDYPEAGLTLYTDQDAVHIEARGLLQGSGDIAHVPEIHPLLFSDITFAARSLLQTPKRSV